MELNQSEREAKDLLEGGFPQVIFYGPPGTGKTRAALNVAASILGLEDAEALSVGDDSPFAFVQFHPSYNYEDFVRGIRVETDAKNNVVYKTENRTFGEMAECAAQKPNEKHVLVIDEINRANVSAVLGELIYGLEYRGKEVQTPYEVGGKTGLLVPENMRIIGTMNTADRTIGQIDYAVRRRFAFVHCPPQRSVLKNQTAGEFFDLVNDVFTHLSVDHNKEDVCIGHSYFLAGGVELANKIIYQVVPILREYLKDGVLGKEAEAIIEKIQKKAELLRKGQMVETKSEPNFAGNRGIWFWEHKESGERSQRLSLGQMIRDLVANYAKRAECQNLEDLRRAFPDHLRPTYGVVRLADDDMVKKHGRVRFFAKEEEWIRLLGGDVVVCNQWGATGNEEERFNVFCDHVSGLGYKIPREASETIRSDGSSRKFWMHHESGDRSKALPVRQMVLSLVQDYIRRNKITHWADVRAVFPEGLATGKIKQQIYPLVNERSKVPQDLIWDGPKAENYWSKPYRECAKLEDGTVVFLFYNDWGLQDEKGRRFEEFRKHMGNFGYEIR